MNIQKMMQQAQQMQKKLEASQSELENMNIAGSAGGGVIEVIVDGKAKFKSIKIKAEAINPENPESVDEADIEMLEDLITSAMNDASTTANKEAESKMKSITGGMPNIPGLF